MSELFLNIFSFFQKIFFIFFNYSRVINFYKNKMLFDPLISDLINKKFPKVDWYILERNNKVVTKKDDIDISSFYPHEMELRFDNRPYEEFFRCIDGTFKKKYNTFLDIGCATGNLISEISRNYNNVSVTGIEYFSYHKEYANKTIKDNIIISDISKKTLITNQFEFVICTEVAEHIHPNKIHIFLENLKTLTKKKLIISWSNVYPRPDAPPQHLCCLDLDDVKILLKNYGFSINHKETKKFLELSYKYENFYFWWRNSLLVLDKDEIP